ncbi:TrmH family RNA methyltransferase [Paraflavitalea speifideaquila]|uniref:TrmH family RNA methyltransferase n=1 Tax=Paraflavitalea speifideaquila TaxID=3076558 RepID=UPI0028EDF757|nr:TrmH family RNA methyltransferase [Paraflavitalea speifideiaquila]
MTPERREKLLSVLNKRQNDLTIVLENVSDPHNISAVMRTCDAIGIQEIFVLNTRIPRHKKWGPKAAAVQPNGLRSTNIRMRRNASKRSGPPIAVF